MKTDQELVEEVRKGGRAAFSELVCRHQKTMLRLALRVTRDLPQAEDVVQESFLKAYEKIDLFAGRSSFRSWLYQITLNTARNRLRGAGRETLGLETENLAVKEKAEAGLIKNDLQRFIEGQVEMLPERQKIALTMRIFDDLSFKEIAEVMGCPYDTAKANYRHALLKLRERVLSDSFIRQEGSLGNLLQEVE